MFGRRGFAWAREVSATINVGIVGLGNMGRPMANNLLRAGHCVHGYDLSQHAMSSAAGDGVACMRNPAELAAQCELVLVMVWDDDALRDVLFGAQGMVRSPRLPACIIDLSTTSAAVAHEAATSLAARGVVFLDGAIIGGGAAAARAASSPIVVAGERKAYERYLPVLERLGRCNYVGAQGGAKVVKIVNNLLVGVVTAANAEALSLGVAMGLDLRELVSLLGAGIGGSRVLDNYMGSFVTTQHYGEGLIGHRLMAKDLQLAAELADAVDCAVALPRFAQQMYVTFGHAMGDGRPFPSAFEYFRKANGAARDRDRGMHGARA